MATGSTALPTDPTARAALYVQRLTAAQAKGPLSPTQQVELTKYAAVAGRAPISSLNGGAGPTASEQAAILATRASGVQQTQAAQAAVTAALTAGPYTQAQAATAYNTAILQSTLAANPNSTIQVNGKMVPLASAAGQAEFLRGTTAPLTSYQSAAITPGIQTVYPQFTAPAVSTGGGVPTPSLAGNTASSPAIGTAQNASPYVPTLDQSGAAASGSGGGAGGGVDTSGTATPGISSTAILVVAGVGAYLLLHKKGKKGGKLL